MSDNYKPATERVREAYVRDQLLAFIASAGEHEAEFDRWLAEVRSKAWDEGLHAGYRHVDRLEQADAAGQGVMIPDPVNPYEEATDGSA